jgi:ABC-2 type transport system permease protein
MKASLIRISALAEKEWVQIRRDWRSLILALAAPSFLVLLFGYALSVDVKDIRFAVMDQDKTAASRQFIDLFRHTEYFIFQTEAGSPGEIDRLIDTGVIRAAFIIPPGFAQRLGKGQSSPVQVLIDGTDSTPANVASGYIASITAEFNAEIIKKKLDRTGVRIEGRGVILEPRSWYNEAMKSRNYILPGLIALILAIICALIASLTISREYERGTLETILSTPVRPAELVAGKIIPYLLIGLFDITTTILLAFILFDLPLKGSFVELIIISMLFLTGMSGMGILVSTATKVQVLSVQVSMVLTYLPTFILSGFMFPVSNMPAAVQGITYLIPARYLITIIKGIALKGAGASMLTAQILFLSLFAIFILAAAARKIAGLYPYRRRSS